MLLAEIALIPIRFRGDTDIIKHTERKKRTIPPASPDTSDSTQSQKVPPIAAGYDKRGKQQDGDDDKADRKSSSIIDTWA